MKQRLLLSMLAFVLVTAFFPGAIYSAGDTKQDSRSGAVSAYSMIQRMGNGINMGNTLEPPYEGEWATAAREYYFDDYKAAGFKNVRIPIRWDNHASKQYPYTIDPAFLNRVEQVVDWSLSRGLVTIINAHHDEWVMDNYSGNIQRLEMIWKQVADRFKYKSDNLLFEVLNEPHGNILDTEINDMNTRILSIIRQTNPTRNVIIGAGFWNSWRAMVYNLQIPNDPYVIATFHYYDPYDFTHEKIGTWGTDNDMTQIRKAFDKVKQWSDKNHIPVYLGEYGVKVESDSQSRVKWYDYVSDAAEHNGFALSVWDDEGWFKLYDRNQRTFNQPTLQAILQKGPFTWPDPVIVPDDPGQPPVYSVGSQLFDSFEGQLQWSSYQGNGATVAHSLVNGNNGKAMQVQFTGSDGGYWGVTRDVNADWSSWISLSLDVKAPSDVTFNIILTEKGTDQTSDGENWKYTIRGSSNNWCTLVIPFSKFTKRIDYQPPGEDGNDKLNLNKLKNIQILQNNSGSGTVVVDNIKLIGLPQ